MLSNLYLCLHLPGGRIVLRPNTNILVEMMRTKDRGVASEVVKVVHNDSDEEIEHEEGREEDEGHEVEVGSFASTRCARSLALSTRVAVQHHLLPVLTRRTSSIRQ